ncbi:hypothetical protein EV361DRAFT_892014 [Lentinula raphanica]|uniref:Extracellular membrane protein CFEM domain-containing protein n=1 Tax=Lentinula raphanica TaxID=153919 RepID=A0AA38UIG0_9AGAR|nr:hypothetical protein C8R42DRAFT_650021 [Lentinula raphanica]KAJ3826610.1 hypothetical protein F5880DRAFT_1543774 [Lentinula raphanica]KAJ3839552.1 hypothetical protein F5878DRAFT_641087 [Lentinula raphanica]KAJ3974890.1 hypothetical protein EV361DRAFT_892014 [Lentinula raphanica]
MVKTTSFLILGGLAAQSFAATESNIWERAYNALDVLIPRQSSTSGIDPSDIPTQCQSQCTTVLNTISTCTTVSCVCTTDNANEMESCVNCLISLDPTASMIEEGNEVLDSMSEECSTVSGFPTLTVSASTTASGDTGSVSFSSLSLSTSSSKAAATTGQSTATTGPAGVSTTGTATSSAESETTSSGSGISGLNGAMGSFKGSMASAVVGVLGVMVGVGVL